MRNRKLILSVLLGAALALGGCDYFEGSTDGDTITEPEPQSTASVTVTVIDLSTGAKVPGLSVEVDTGASGRASLGTTNANGVAGTDRETAVPTGWGEDTHGSYRADVRIEGGLAGNGVYYVTTSAADQAFSWITDEFKKSSWNSVIRVARVSR